MKIFVCIFVFICFVNISDQTTFSDLKKRWQSFLLKYADKCIKETGVSRCRALRVLPHGEYIKDDYKLKCFLRCISTNLDVTDKNGTVDTQRFLHILGIDNGVIEDTSEVEKCFKITNKDQCVAAFEFSKCTYETVEKEINKQKS